MSLGKAIKGLRRIEPLLVTPLVEDFLRRVPDGVIWDEAGYALWRKLTEKAAQNEDRSGRFGASSRGMCHRRQVFGFLGMPSAQMIDPETQNLFNDGKWRHLRWQMMAMQAGALTHVEYPYAYPKLRVSGSMDGLNSYEKFGFELKGDRNMARTMDGLPDAHDQQMQTMMMATGWDRFSYIIEDKSSQNWREMIVRPDPVVMRQIRDELEVLNEHVDDRVLPEVLPACRAKEGPYRSCPFARQCLERDRTHGRYFPDYPGDWSS